MFVEYGKLKMWLVGLQGALTPLTISPLAELLPDPAKAAVACLHGLVTALFVYLLKPAPEQKVEPMINLDTETGEKDKK